MLRKKAEKQYIKETSIISETMDTTQSLIFDLEKEVSVRVTKLKEKEEQKKLEKLEEKRKLDALVLEIRKENESP